MITVWFWILYTAVSLASLGLGCWLSWPRDLMLSERCLPGLLGSACRCHIRPLQMLSFSLFRLRYSPPTSFGHRSSLLGYSLLDLLQKKTKRKAKESVESENKGRLVGDQLACRWDYRFGELVLLRFLFGRFSLAIQNTCWVPQAHIVLPTPLWDATFSYRLYILAAPG